MHLQKKKKEEWHLIGGGSALTTHHLGTDQIPISNFQFTHMHPQIDAQIVSKALGRFLLAGVTTLGSSLINLTTVVWSPIVGPFWGKLPFWLLE
ncbi:unnamed protein product [Ambrosiozyma monospora]|uniref:Unnamed protein product n=1 Tax=Ambrosiozyma monospora TaxID=43982 RepID=A0A9W6Z4I8_AMBMO|nr:unnamed protein product [Ambrosiozyma monospora]